MFGADSDKVSGNFRFDCEDWERRIGRICCKVRGRLYET